MIPMYIDCNTKTMIAVNAKRIRLWVKMLGSRSGYRFTK